MVAASLILVSFGRGQLVQRCVASIRRHTPEPIELILVDNPREGDPIGDEVWGQARPDRLIRNRDNVGFAAGVEVGRWQASAPVLVLVNPDLEVTEGWLAPLLEVLERPDVVAAAPVLLNPDGSIQEQGSVVGPDGETVAIGRFPADAMAGDLTERPVDYASGACLALDAAAVERVGGLDVNFGAGYFEDVDLLYRLREQGGQGWLVPRSRVVHALHGTSSAAEAAAMMDERRQAFVERWRHRLVGRPPLVDLTARAHRLKSAIDLHRPDRLLLIADDDDPRLATATALAERHPELALTVLGHRRPVSPGSQRVRWLPGVVDEPTLVPWRLHHTVVWVPADDEPLIRLVEVLCRPEELICGGLTVEQLEAVLVLEAGPMGWGR